MDIVLKTGQKDWSVYGEVVGVGRKDEAPGLLESLTSVSSMEVMPSTFPGGSGKSFV